MIGADDAISELGLFDLALPVSADDVLKVVKSYAAEARGKSGEKRHKRHIWDRLARLFRVAQFKKEVGFW